MDSLTAPRLISALRDAGIAGAHLEAAATLLAAAPVAAALAYVDDQARAARLAAAAELGTAALMAEVQTINALNGPTGHEARYLLAQWHGQSVVSALDRAAPGIVKAVAPRLEAASAAVTTAEDALPRTGLERPRWADANGYPHAAVGHGGHTVTARTLRADAARIGPHALAALVEWEAATTVYDRLVGIVDMLRAGGYVDNAHPLVRSRFRPPTAPQDPEITRAEQRAAAERTERADGSPGRPYLYTGV